MMSSAPSPPILPATNAVGGGDATVTTPAFRLFISRLSDSVRRSLSQLRPWSELTDRTAFSRPESVSDATSRLRNNLAYFRFNYATIVAAVLVVSLITNPFSLIVLLALLAAWCQFYFFRPSDPPLVLFGRTYSDRETLGGLVLLSFIVVFLTSVGSIIVSALVAGATLVAVHGACRVPEDLFLDEQEVGANIGDKFLSFLGGAASSAAAAASPAVVAARV